MTVEAFSWAGRFYIALQQNDETNLKSDFMDGRIYLCQLCLILLNSFGNSFKYVEQSF